LRNDVIKAQEWLPFLAFVMSRRKSIYWLNACELKLGTYQVDAQESILSD